MIRSPSPTRPITNCAPASCRDVCPAVQGCCRASWPSMSASARRPSRRRAPSSRSMVWSSRRPDEGMVVRQLSAADVTELYNARILLEKAALESAIAMGAITQELLASLADSLERHGLFARGGTLDDLSSALSYDRDFHRRLVVAAGNRHGVRLACPHREPDPYRLRLDPWKLRALGARAPGHSRSPSGPDEENGHRCPRTSLEAKPREFVASGAGTRAQAGDRSYA